MPARPNYPKLRRRHPAFLSALTLASASLFAAGPSHADVYYSGGLTSAKHTWYRPNYNSAWNAALATAESAWNAVPEVAFRRVSTKTPATPSTITVASYTASWYGLYTPREQHTSYYSGRYFNVSINSRTISKDSKNFNGFVRSVTVHELGHALSLGDNPPTSAPSIMKYSRDRNTLITHTHYDRANVSRRY